MKRSLDYLKYLRQRQKTRKQLLDLPNERLGDLGLSRQQADNEGRKRFWQ